MRILFVILTIIIASQSRAQDEELTYLGTLGIAQLNAIMTKERADFLPQNSVSANYRWPQVFDAKHEVELYRVSYSSSIPELSGKPTRASGLLAIPKTGNTKALPVLSYQHGTVYGKYEVPSYAFSEQNPSGYSQYEGAYETRLMVAQYAGQGYVVMAPDYFGMGDSSEPEAYMVKASSQQACFDFYKTTSRFLKEKGISQKALFLAGWSQGGLVTSAFLQTLERRSIPVNAVFTAASPNDPFAAMNGFIYHTRAIDAFWSNSILALTVFSYEHYYQKSGLASTVIHPDYYEPLRKIYQRDYSSASALLDIFSKLADSRPVFKDYFRTEYLDPAYFADSEYGKLLANAEAYRQLLHTPVRMYAGSQDEIVAQAIGELGAIYQKSMGNHQVNVVVVEGGNHRGTFLTAVSSSLKWLNQFSQ